MTAIFVHSVPDTDHVWHRVIPQLDRNDVVTLRLPGFGAPLPSGFNPTKDEYAAWLVAQIATHRAPVDLVGHDWGALLAIRAASLRPDLIRSWAMGAREAGAHFDETMKRAILRLYRSAITVGAAWGPDLARITAPGLILWGANDPYAAPTWGERLAQRTGARCVIFPGCSHWWPLERPAEVASELRRLWSGIAA